jgi:hypothetical protein
MSSIRLSDELYTKDTHFLLEFIQNADDNEYAADVIPTLRLKLDNGHIYICCNEVGFSEEMWQRSVRSVRVQRKTWRGTSV